MKARNILAVAVLATAGVAFATYPETRTVLLGDLNQTYDGPGSSDDVYVSPELAQWIEDGYSSAIHFDVMDDNREVPFTFEFLVGPDEEVVGASLTMCLRYSGWGGDHDWIVLHPDTFPAETGGRPEDGRGAYAFDSLGWIPSFDEYIVFSVDVSDMNGDDWLDRLQDGRLDCHVTDDTAVSWARLDYTVTPEPATLSLLALGGLALLRRRRNTSNRARA